MTERNSFTDKEDRHLIAYIGKYCPENKNRSGNLLYERLVANTQKKWPWSKSHTSKSWRERYVRRKDWFDKHIKKWQAQNPSSLSSSLPLPSHHPLASSSALPPRSIPTQSQSRQPFTDKDDELLVSYLARETPDGVGRKGHGVYQRLVSRPDRYPWSTHHTAQSWLERYRRRSDVFDRQIRKYQDEHGIKRTGKVGIKRMDEHGIKSKGMGTGKVGVKEMQKSKKRRAEEEEEEEEEGDGDGDGGEVVKGMQKSKKRRAEEEKEEEEEEGDEVGRRKRRKVEVVSEEVGEKEEEEKEKVDVHQAVKEEEEEEEEQKMEKQEEEEQEEQEEQEAEKEEEKARKDVNHKISPPPKPSSIADSPARQRSSVPPPPPASRQRPFQVTPKHIQEPISTQETAVAKESVVNETDIEMDELDIDIRRPPPQEANKEELEDPPQTATNPEANTQPTPTNAPTQESYVVPSPETLRKLAVADILGLFDVSQEPTHHTSGNDAVLSSSEGLLVGREGAVVAQESPRVMRNDHEDANEDEGDEDETVEFGSGLPAAQSSVPRQRAGARQSSSRLEGAFDVHTMSKASRVGGVEVSDEEMELRALWPPKRGKGKAPAVSSTTTRNVAASSSTTRNTPPAIAATSSRQETDIFANTNFAKQPAKSVSTKRLYPAARKSLSLQPRLDLQESFTSRLATPRNPRATAQPEAGPSNLRLTAVTDTMKRRHTLATPALNQGDLSLRYSLPAYERRHSTETDSITSNVSFGGRIVTAEDHKFIFDYGMRSYLQQMATDSGFAYSTVENVWKLSGTLADTATTLDMMRKQAEEGGNSMLEVLRVEERVKERERPVLENQIGEMVDLGCGGDVRRTLVVLDREGVEVDDEYWPPEDSKAGILVRKRMRAQERKDSGGGREGNREEGDVGEGGDDEKPQADEVEEREDEDAGDESDSDDDSRYLQVRRILRTVRKNYNK